MTKMYTRAQVRVDSDLRKRLLEDTSLPVPFVASTPGKKADGFDLRAQDWNLDRFRNYPVILFGHDFAGRVALPLGRGENTHIDSNGELLIDIRYDEDDPFAMRCRSKAIKGMMAGSVSWDRVDNQNQLIEFSNVPVGLDPDSLPQIERLATRSMLEDIMDGYGGDGDDKLSHAFQSLRDKVSELMVELSADTRDETPEEDSPEPDPVPEVPANGRSLEFWDMADQVFDAIRAVVQSWFSVVGLFFENGRKFAVISLDGKLWRYDFTIDEATDEIVLGDGMRVKQQFVPVDEPAPDTARGQDGDMDDEERMDMPEDGMDEEERMDTEDDLVTEEDEPMPEEVREEKMDESVRKQFEAILARADQASRKLSEV